MSILSKIRNRLLLSLALGALVFLGLSLYANIQELMAALRSFRWGFFPWILSLALGNYLLRFLKWDYYLGGLSISISKEDSLAIFFSGLTMSVTPGKLGEVLKSFLLKARQGTPISLSAPIVVAERLTDFLAVIALASLGVYAFGYGARTLAITLALVLLVVLILGCRPVCLRLLRPLEALPFLGGFPNRLEVAYESIAELVRLRRLLAATAISVLAWFAECLGFYMVFLGFGFPSSWLQATFIYAFSTLVGALTMLPGGLGATEGSMTGLLLRLPVPRQQAVAATLLIRLATLWFAVLVGAGVLIFYQRRLLTKEGFLATKDNSI
ncbi:MAG: flippase-like domain-containing protein [candidate division NC10 bacterium]|nr:flippase-like domain-containing protein [candidate division NC10 bacterium]